MAKGLEADRPGKIFVGGVDLSVDEETLEKLFSKFGKITEVLLKRDKGSKKQSRGYGFITFENPADAEEAVKAMDGQDINGKTMHVDQAMKGGSDEDSPRRPSRGPPRGRGGLRGKPRGFGGGGRGGSRFGGDRGGSRFGGDRGGSRFGGDRRFGRGPPDRLGKRPVFGGRGKPPRGRGGRIGRDGPVPRRDSFGDRGDRMRDSRGPPPRGLDSRGPPRGLDSRGPPPRGLDSHGPPNRGPRDDDRGYGLDRMDPIQMQ